jgi:DnaJ family protein A protein 2
MSSKNLYETLGVDKSASSADIRKAFQRLAKVHHPDKGGDEEKFKEIRTAHEILCDDEKKAFYDATGQVPGEGGGQGGQGGGQGGMPFDFANMFGGMFGAGGMPNMMRQQKRQGKAPPYVQHIPISLKQFYTGHSFEVRIDRSKFCDSCDATGAKTKKSCAACKGTGHRAQIVQMGPMVMQTNGPCGDCNAKGFITVDNCDKCNGTGKTKEQKVLDIKILPGTNEGEVYTFPGACSDNDGFEKPGDVHIVLDSAESGVQWERKGDKARHLETNITLSLSESLLGCVVRIDGHPAYDTHGLFVKIPVGSFEGDVYCISGLGMPIKGEPMKNGDLYIRIHVNARPDERRALKASIELGELANMKDKCRSINIPDGLDVKNDIYLSSSGNV